MDTILAELQKAILSNFQLSADYLEYCLGANSTIIVWNGSSDMRILSRLGFTNLILNITTHDDYDNNEYYLNLYNLNNNRLLLSHCLVYVKKNGRYLSLTETLKLICKNKIHTSLIVHNPVNDVILTSRIFQYLLKSTRTTNILNLID